MRDHSNHIESSRHVMVREVMKRWKFTRRTETIPTIEAVGRICAETLTSKNTLPGKLTSNMDGIGVYFADFADGMPDVSTWERGKQWQFCNTGVAMPADYDTAIRIEDVTIEGDKLIALDAAPDCKGASTTDVGARVREGELLVKAGQELTPSLLAALAMGGYTQVKVIAKAKVAFIPTGNELVAAGAELPEDKNVETNGIMTRAKLTQWGAEPLMYDIIPDDWDIIESTLKDAVAKADIVIINAGSSKGSEDFTCEILEQDGDIICHQLNQGPGRHASAAMLEGCPVIGISGPPAGAEFTTDWLVKPLVDLYMGRSLDFPPTVMARMLDACPMNPRPVTPVRRAQVWRDEFGGFVARLLPPSPAVALTTYDDANALITIPTDSYGWQEGDFFEVELRWPYRIPPLVSTNVDWE